MSPRAAATTFLLLAGCALPAAALTIYDPALGLPSAQNWSPVTNGSVGGSQSMVGGLYQLDTTAADKGYGNLLSSPLLLDDSVGYVVTFDLKVASETHADSTRAGYSVLVLGQIASHAIELAFWTDHIWAYGYNASLGDPFFHGPDVAFDTTASLRTYTLAVAKGQYSLSVGASTLLSGSLINYAQSGIVPYVIPNLIYFGDDTSRGSSVTQLGLVTLAVPEPAPAALLAAGLAMLAWRRKLRV